MEIQVFFFSLKTMKTLCHTILEQLYRYPRPIKLIPDSFRNFEKLFRFEMNIFPQHSLLFDDKFCSFKELN